MKILIIDNYSKYKLIQSEAVPDFGHQIYLGYNPAPKVRDIVWFPAEAVIKQILGKKFQFVDILVYAHD